MATSARCSFRGCNHSVMFRPASLLATPVAPTTVMLRSPSVDSLTSSFLSVSRRVPHLVESWTYLLYTTEQPWRFLPNNSRFVTSPSPGYASRLNRAIDDRGFSPHKIHSLVGCPHRGRTVSYPTAPAQIPACGFPAPGSSEILASAFRPKLSKPPFSSSVVLRSVAALC